MNSNKFIQLLLLTTCISANVHIWEPKSLRNIYSNKDFPYTIMNFGNVPYGHSVYGTVFKATPYDACSDLNPVSWDKNYGTLIILVHRNGCNFSEKVLNAQKIGAGLVLISDNVNEDVHRIFPIERTKEMIDQVQIPSLLIAQQDADNIIRALESSQDPGKLATVELAVFFTLTKSYVKSTLKLVLAVDDYRSYDLVSSFKPYYKQFEENMNFEIHFKLFQKQTTKFMNFQDTDCVGQDQNQFCATKSFEDHANVQGLGKETLRQLCLKNLSMEEYFDYSQQVRSNCFNNQRVSTDFAQCTQKQFEKLSSQTQQNVNQCSNMESNEYIEALKGNHENIKYLLINYSPLIFINGFYYKGNYDNMNHLMESFCNSFESPPKECANLDAFQTANDLNSTHLSHFIFLSCVICLSCGVIAILIFYILMKKKIKKNFAFTLNDKINQALAQYYEDGNQDEEDTEEIVANVKNNSQLININQTKNLSSEFN